VPDHGTDLGVDLYALERVAKDLLPSVSAIYGDAVAKYGQARSALDGAMNRPDHFGGSALGPVHPAWAELHAAAVKFMTDTQTNLNDTATSLAEAAELYASTDSAAAKEFRRLLEERGEPKPGK
jgi:Excreted virulence factor EspC, type VII ESX diderm